MTGGAVERFRVALHHHDGWVCLDLDGALRQPGTDELNAVAWPLLGRYDGDQIVLDCADLTAIDGDGAAELLRLSRALGPGERPVLRDLAADLTVVIPELEAHFQLERTLTDATG